MPEWGRRQRRINVLDTVDERSHKLARSRTALVRIGTVVAANVGNSVLIKVGNATFEAITFVNLAIGEVVAVTTDTDAWWVIGRYGTITSGVTPYAFAGHLAAKITGPINNTLVVCDQVTANQGPFTVSAAGVTIPRKGVWEVRFQALVAAGSAAHSQLWVKTAAGAGVAYGALWVTGNANHVMAAYAPAVNLNAGDVIKCYATYPGDIFPTDSQSNAWATELTLHLVVPT